MCDDQGLTDVGLHYTNSCKKEKKCSLIYLRYLRLHWTAADTYVVAAALLRLNMIKSQQIHSQKCLISLIQIKLISFIVESHGNKNKCWKVFMMIIPNLFYKIFCSTANFLVGNDNVTRAGSSCKHWFYRVHVFRNKSTYTR